MTLSSSTNILTEASILVIYPAASNLLLKILVFFMGSSLTFNNQTRNVVKVSFYQRRIIVKASFVAKGCRNSYRRLGTSWLGCCSSLCVGLTVSTLIGDGSNCSCSTLNRCKEKRAHHSCFHPAALATSEV